MTAWVLACLLGVAPVLTVSGRGLQSASGYVLAGVDPALAFSLQFAPATGTGMGTACAGANVTAQDGTPAVFTRSTIAHCTKHSWWTGIFPGDVVELAIDRPAIEPGGDGTGQLRYLSEAVGHNYVKDSEDFTATTWKSLHTAGVAACTVSPPDAGASPRGDSTATRLRCPATPAGEYSFIYQDDAVPGTPASGAVYMRSYSTASVGHYAVNDNSATTWVDCDTGGDFDAGWMRCKQENITNGIVLSAIGNVNAAGHSSAFDVFIWGAGTEVSKGVTSYIHTDGGTGVRSETALYIPSPVPAGANLQISASILTHVVPAFGGALTSLSNGATNQLTNSETATSLTCHLDRSAVTTDVTIPGTFAPDAVNATVCSYDGVTTLAGCLGSSCNAGTVNAVPGDYDKLWVGTLFTGSTQPNGWLGPISVYSSAQKDIYLYGDGVVDGFPGYTATPQAIIRASEGNLVAVQNLATTGDRIETCADKWTTTVASVRASGSTRANRTYLMVQCGINGMTDGGTDAGQISDILEAMMLDAADAGISHAMWSTITPFSANSSAQARDIQVNATMASFCTAHGYYQADTFTALGGPGCDTSLVQCADGGVHLQDAGQVVETTLWQSRGGW